MKRKVNCRNKAFIGAAIGAVGNIIGGVIGARKQKKAQEKAYRESQIEQTRNEGIQQAAAMSAQYANQDYVDEYKNKITFKNGGKLNMKKKGNDRIKVAKTFKCGGRKKANFGSDLLGSIKDGMTSGLMDGAISGVGSAISSAISKPNVQKQIKKADGFNYGNPKTNIETNDYQLDANGNPINVANTNNIGINYNDRLQQARLGTRKKRKC